MFEIVKIGFLSVTFFDLLDIFLVTFIVYKLYTTIRGTIAAQIFIGLIIILVLSFLVLLIGGVLYYLLSKSHTITVSLMETVSGLNVSVNGTTVLSSSIAKDFQDTIVTFDTGTTLIGYRIQEIKCPKCGSSLDYTGNSSFVKCAFCGTNLSISELRK